MAHFAKLDENNVVVDVLVVSNETIGNLPFPESEPAGVAFLSSLFSDTSWKQTSYNNNFRFRYAGVGYVFHPECGEHGGFSAPPAYPSFVFNPATCSWEAPVPYPQDGDNYYWDEDQLEWKKYTPPFPVTVLE